MKRFYTVKEASEILGFSTNTVYKYLDEGKLKGKRIGKGRFKIPQEELAPYLSTGEKIEQVVEEKTRGDKISEAIKDMGTDFKGVAPGKRDFVFFRLFLGLALLGAALINFFWVEMNYGVPLITKYPFAFLTFLAGALILASSFIWRKSKKFNLWVHIFAIVALLYGSYVSFIARNYALGVFLISFLGIIITHLARGFENCCENSSFKREFIFFTLIASSAVGILTLIDPNFFTVPSIALIATNYKTLFGILWFSIIVLPSLYLLGRPNSKLFFYIFPVNVILPFMVASGAADRAVWDLSFGAFLYGTFAMFLLWWEWKGSEIEESKFHIVGGAFLWIAAAIILGLLAIQSFQGRIIESTSERMKEKLSEVVKDIDYLFGNSEGIVHVDSAMIADIALAGDEESAIAQAKEIYDKSTALRRVVVLSSQGKVLGAYPRNSILQGADVSSREYVQVVKRTLRPYASSTFESLLNYPVTIKGIPVFKNNQLAGIVGIAFNLEELTARYQSPGSGGDIYAFDENNKFSLNIDKTKIGTDVPEPILQEKDEIVVSKKGTLRIYDYAVTPRWTVYIERQTSAIIGKVSPVNDVAAVIIAVNSILSLGAAFTLAKKWRA